MLGTGFMVWVTNVCLTSTKLGYYFLFEIASIGILLQKNISDHDQKSILYSSKKIQSRFRSVLEFEWKFRCDSYKKSKHCQRRKFRSSKTKYM